MGQPKVARRWRTARQIDLRAQLGPLRRGSGDPTWFSEPGGALWRTTLTPEGPGLERIAVERANGTVELSSWGPGAQWLADRLPTLLGEGDDPRGFQAPPVLTATARRFCDWRIGRTDRVLEALIPAILEQKVTGKEAWLGWRTLVREFGEPAPGSAALPRPLMVFPAPEVWAQIPSWRWHQAAVDSKRSQTVLRAVREATTLEEIGEIDRVAAQQRLRQIPGIGIWTAAETVQRATGDPDAVSYRDYHLAQEIVYLFTGDRNGTDEQLARLLLPFAGHRYRIQRLSELSGYQRPRRGPRMTVHDMRTM